MYFFVSNNPYPNDNATIYLHRMFLEKMVPIFSLIRNDVLAVDDKEEKKPELVPESVLAVIEEAYPNSLTIDDMSRRFKAETEIVRNMVLELVDKKLVKPVGAGVPGAAGLDSAAGAFRRVHQNEEEVTIVKQMPRGVEKAMQPTIAVITAQYFEKMAVDAMMTNKQ